MPQPRLLPRAAQNELHHAAALLPLLVADLPAERRGAITASGASPFGCGVCRRHTPAGQAAAIGRTSEKRRFHAEGAIDALNHALGVPRAPLEAGGGALVEGSADHQGSLYLGSPPGEAMLAGPLDHRPRVASFSAGKLPEAPASIAAAREPRAMQRSPPIIEERGEGFGQVPCAHHGAPKLAGGLVSALGL